MSYYGGSGKAWIVAACVGAVEALKDQGFARWNYTIRSLHQHAKANQLRSYWQANKKAVASSTAVAKQAKREDRRAEESLRTVMYLSCWGPN